MHKIKLGALAFRAGFKPDSYNADKNTMDVIWTTGARVKRFSWSDGEFYEELSTKKAHVNLGRLNSGAPLLNNHGTGMFGGVQSLSDVIGVVETARMEDGVGVATVRFSDRPELAGLIGDIKSGIIRNISVGYRVNKFEEQKQKVDGLPVLRAVDWEPMELSFVGIPADKGAQSRGHEPTSEVDVLTNREEEDMGKRAEDEKAKAEAEAKAKAEADAKAKAEAEAAAEVEEESEESESDDAPAADETEESERSAKTVETATATVDAEKIRKEEQTRHEEIRKAVRVAQLDEKFADDILKNPKMSVVDARAAIFQELEKRTETTTRNQRVEVKSMEQLELRRAAAVRGLLNRFDAQKYKLEQGDGEFSQGSLIDTARHMLSLEGVKEAYTMPRSEVAKRALMSSSDFPYVLANVANKVLREAYQGAPNTYEPFTAMRSVKDFKEVSSVTLGNGGKLQAMTEHGEYKRTSISESAQKYSVTKYGVIVGRTYELMVNDDLGAFTTIAQKLGTRAKEKENEVFWNLIINNQVMLEDGLALFHATHANLTASGTAISVASLGVARTSLRLQRDLEGELLNLNPKYLVVPAAKETIAQQFISQISPIQGADVNVFANKLQVITEPRLDAASGVSWYAAVDKGQLQIGEMALIDGQGPEIMVKEGWDVDGMETKIRHNFGMAIVDFRGIYKNAGA